MSAVESLTMSVEEAAQQLGICTKIAYQLTHRADFPTIKIGRRTRVSREGLREWVRSQEQNRMEVAQ
ncbi:MAG: helix-turn-helix domain-containing protein [Oscillospiraceae bacterium]|nr:helix-turn-helix domain-containing protein [Oscillospiraceae bacterium]